MHLATWDPRKLHAIRKLFARHDQLNTSTSVSPRARQDGVCRGTLHFILSSNAVFITLTCFCALQQDSPPVDSRTACLRARIDGSWSDLNTNLRNATSRRVVESIETFPFHTMC